MSGATLGVLLVASVSGQAAELKTHCQTLVGQSFFLRVDVIRIESTIGGKDVTNVHPDGRVYYRGKVGNIGNFKAKESDNADDFAADARSDRGGQVRVYRKGSPITVHEVEVEDEEVNVGITVQSGSKTRISFKLKKGYSAADFDAVFAAAFAKEESELAGATNTVNISLGMSTAEITKLKGKPNTRVDLGSKTMLNYADMKLVFENDRLVDVQ
jgi:hypothetical protein